MDREDLLAAVANISNLLGTAARTLRDEPKTVCENQLRAAQAECSRILEDLK